jgi:hypothetical protein
MKKIRILFDVLAIVGWIQILIWSYQLVKWALLV